MTGRARLAKPPARNIKYWYPYGTEFLHLAHIPWTLKEFLSGLFLLGVPGSGKTVTIDHLLMQVLPRLRQDDAKAIIYDCKAEYYSLAAACGLTAVVLHPFDDRCTAVDLARELALDPSQAAQNIAEAIVIVEGDQPHFPKTARRLVADACLALHDLAPEAWDALDLILFIREPVRLRWLLSNCAATRDTVAMHFPSEGRQSDEFSSVLSVLDTQISEFLPIAIAWRRAREHGRTICLSEWTTSTPDHQRVLLLGNDDSKPAIQAANRIVLNRLMSRLLSPDQTASPDRPRTWFILDEVSDLGCVEQAPRFIPKCRSYGCAVVMGAQSVCRVDTDYGKDRSRGMLASLASNFICYKVSSGADADFAAQIAGEGRRMSASKTESKSADSTNAPDTSSETTRPETRKVIAPGEFTALCLPFNGQLHGWVIKENYCYKTYQNIAQLRLPRITGLANYVPAPVSDLSPRFTLDDFSRLNIPIAATTLSLLGVSEPTELDLLLSEGDQ